MNQEDIKAKKQIYELLKSKGIIKYNSYEKWLKRDESDIDEEVFEELPEPLDEPEIDKKKDYEEWKSKMPEQELKDYNEVFGE